MVTRILLTLFFIALILYTPWWIAFFGVVLGAFYIRTYYEIIVLGIFFDLLYGAGSGFAVGYGIIGVVVGFVLFTVIEKIKKELR